MPYQTNGLTELSGVSKLTFITPHKNNVYEPFEALRIDTWTSHNIAWPDGAIISEVVSDNHESGDYSFLFDGILSEDKTKNVKFKRGDTIYDPTPGSNEKIENEIDIKFNFKSVQQIQSLCFVVQYEQDDLYSGNISDEPLFKLSLILENNETAILDGSKNGGFYEVVSINPKIKRFSQDMRFEYDQFGISEMHPGYGLYTGKNSVNASDLVYDYFILDQPVKCKSIRLSFITQEKNPNFESILISEAMIFPNNPLEGFIINKKDIIEGASDDYVSDYIQEGHYYWGVHSGTNMTEALVNTDFGIEPYFISAYDQTTPYTIYYNNTYFIDQVVVWEKTSTNIVKAKTAQIDYNVHEVYWNMENSDIENPATNIKSYETPFIYEGKKILGNPLPYAVKGIDSPRTFAYKMYEQFYSRLVYTMDTYSYNTYPLIHPPTIMNLIKNNMEKYKDFSSPYRPWITTMATNEKNIINYNDYYINEGDLYAIMGINSLGRYSPITGLYQMSSGDYPIVPIINRYKSTNYIVKPFLPGFQSQKIDQEIININSPFSVDKIAGVDSIGIISGVVSMGELNGIYNIFNKSVGKTLDNFFAMKKSVDGENNPAGLDNEGKPTFYNNGFEGGTSYLSERAYRFTRADLERNTVIVPDISEIRMGDLLVDNSVGIEPHIGIVIGMEWNQRPQFGSSVDSCWNNIIVLSIRKGQRTVSIGRWGNPNGIYGGFSDTPENYHIRRFLVKVDNNDFRPGEKENWEPINNRIKQLDCTIQLEKDISTDSIDHWIPNTDEIFKRIKTITLNAYGNFDNNFTSNIEILPDPLDPNNDLNYIRILSPIDQNFKTFEGKTDIKSNVFANKGTGLEFFAYTDTDYNEFGLNGPILIATIKLKANEIATDGDDRYIVTYNESFFYSDGSPKGDYRLYINKENHLSFHYVHYLNNEIDFTIDMTRFGFKAIGNIRPGDDFLFRFGLVNGLNGNPAPPDQFLSVFDKKMLWRASLYIEEDENDWNDINPWNAEVSINDWNRKYTFNSTAFDMTDFAKAEGGQVISINSWTKINEGDFKSNADPNAIFSHYKNRTGIAYTNNDTDTQFRFNWEMDKQREAMDALISKVRDESSSAPENDWKNYIGHPLSVLDVDGLKLTKAYNSFEEKDINFSRYQPFRPNYSAYLKYELENDINWFATSQSSGIDCGAFIWVSFMYPDNPYYNQAIYDPEYGINWNGTNPGSFSPGYFSPTWNDDPRTEEVEDVDQDWNIFDHRILYDYNDSDMYTNMPIIPGDVLIFKKDDGGYPHAAMVYYIKDYGANRKIHFDDIVLIEAASGFNREYRVINYQTFWGYIAKWNQTYWQEYYFNRLRTRN